MQAPLALALTFLVATAVAQDGKPDSEGFIRDWLVLAPLSIGDSSGADEIDKKQFADEAQPAAKDGAKQKIGSAELTWKKPRPRRSTSTSRSSIRLKATTSSAGRSPTSFPPKKKPACT